MTYRARGLPIIRRGVFDDQKARAKFLLWHFFDRLWVMRAKSMDEKKWLSLHLLLEAIQALKTTKLAAFLKIDINADERATESENPHQLS